MTERNEVMTESVVMSGLLGRNVPNCKALLSHDWKSPVGHSVLMADKVEKIAESAWREAFVERLRAIQGNRTQDQMARLLGISRDSWNKCVNRGDAPSIRILPLLAALGQISLEELIDGPEVIKKPAAAKPKPGTRRQAS